MAGSLGNDDRKEIRPPEQDDDVYDVRTPEPVYVPEPPRFLMRPIEPVVERRVKPPPPPQWVFLSGVFNFPFYLHTLPRWLLMSLGLSATLFLLTSVIWCLSVGLGQAAYALGFSTFWLGVFSLSYASACTLVVVQQTGVGDDRIEEWPQGDWREWFWSMLFFVGILAASAGLAGFARWMLGPLVTAPLAVCVMAVYPVLLLSALDTGNPLYPFSPVIFKTLVSHWWAWGIFVVLSTLTALPTLAALAYLWIENPFILALAAGPVLAAVILVYARLLGRLLWCFQPGEDDE